MARLFYVVLVFLFISQGDLSSQSWNKGFIKGEGEVVKVEVSLPTFSGIALGFNGDILLTPGATQKVVIEGQQNIIDNINRKVSGGKWDISYIENVKDAKAVKVYITIPTVDYVAISGSGSLHSDGKFLGLGDIKLAVSGSGNLRMDIEARKTEVRINGSADVALKGSSTSLSIAISGSGDVTATALVTDECNVRINGSGDVGVHVNGDLEAHISGSGDVKYKGTASVTARISGSGTVTKI